MKTSTISSRMICNRGTAIFCSRLLLGTVLLLNAACTILNYHPTTPITKLPVENHDRREFLSYSYISGFPIDSNEQKIPWPSQLLKESLEKHTRFIKVIITPSPPASGVHVNVYQTDGSPPEVAPVGWTA